MNAKHKADIYESVTNNIITALEKGVSATSWSAPWHKGASLGLPENVLTHKAYRGVNVFLLWGAQMELGYPTAHWGTYKQWATKGAQVRGGEKGTTIWLWKQTQRKVTDAETGEEGSKKSLFATSFTVFNAAQVDGWDAPAIKVNPFDAIDHAEQFLGKLGADVRHGGNRAYYSPGLDRIQLPLAGDFVDNVGYYATSAHEHVHWTSNEKRCDRKLGDRFGDKQYAAEELIAELGAAYVCAHLGLTNEPRADHAQYLANWLTLLKEDPKAIITAASKAQQAVDWLVDKAGESIDSEPEVEAAIA